MDELKEQVTVSLIPVSRVRLYGLRDLEQMLDSFYGFYNREVNEPYLVQEQKTLVRVVKLITFQLQDKSMPVGTQESASGLKCGHFRFVLPERKPFSVVARTSCLQQLEEYLTQFFILFECRSTGIPYSITERQVLRRIKKQLVHQLKGTDKYRMFKKKSPSHAGKITPAEMLELRNQQKDEKLLGVACGRITKINPHSEKYKALKEEQLRKIREMD